MPTDAARAREREAVETVVAAMNGSSPSELMVQVDGWPDGDRRDAAYPSYLTVDAVLKLSDGESERLWAADVMTLPWDHRLTPAVEGVQERLQQALEAVVSSHADVRLAVCFRPPIAHSDNGRAYVDAIVARASQLLAGDSGRDPFAADPDTSFHITRGPLADGEPRVALFHTLATTPSIREQLEEAFVAGLERKLLHQLHRAHEGGYPTILIVDALGAPDLPHGANFLASEATVGQVIAETVIRLEHSGEPHVLDFSVLVRSDGGCSPAYGYWPSRVAP